MKLSYQQKRVIRIGIHILLILLLLAVLFCVCRVIYLQRFLVYDENGVHLDFAGTPTASEPKAVPESGGEFALVQQPLDLPPVSAPSRDSSELPRGIEISAAQVLDFSLHETIRKAAKGADIILLPVKNGRGQFLYRTAIGGTDTAGSNPDAISVFLSELAGDCHLTALLPAFADSSYALQDYTHSLLTQAISLCTNENGSYLLDPASPDTKAYLLAQARELAAMGFREICLTDFDFPTPNGLEYTGDGAQAVRDLAEDLARTLRQENIDISFLSEDDAVTALSDRVYITAQDGNAILPAVEKIRTLFSDDNTKLVFRTGSHDTRFQAYASVTPLKTD